MTLLDTIRVVEGAAAAQPTVNMIVRADSFKLNGRNDAKYGAFAWVQGQHSAALEGGWRNYVFSLFYIDRLTEDRGNETEVQSVGIDTLTNILRTVESAGIYIEGTPTFQPFTQKYLDECAGVYCNVTLQVYEDTLCPETFAAGADGSGILIV